MQTKLKLINCNTNKQGTEMPWKCENSIFILNTKLLFISRTIQNTKCAEILIKKRKSEQKMEKKKNKKQESFHYAMHLN